MADASALLNRQWATVRTALENRRAKTVAAAPAIDKVHVEDLNVWFGSNHALKHVSLSVPERRITSIIGPSGCGKSTFIRSLNRMVEVIPRSRVEGKVLLDGEDIYGPQVDPVEVRRRVGMVFQQANPFAAMTLYENVAFGLKIHGVRDPKVLDKAVVKSLKQAALWEEVKDRLDDHPTSLSGGQQQRLCIARALAVEPEVLLLDEPASALDPIATSKIEDLMLGLRDENTLVLVTHNMQQAARVADFTGFFYLGELIEFGVTDQIFENPGKELTEHYITGRFG